MRQKRFLAYFVVQTLIIVAVTIIFKTPQEIKIAAVEAGFLFVLTPIFLVAWDWRYRESTPVLFYVGLAQFWILFALPILGIRLLHWDIPFDQLSVFGVPGPTLHRFATDSYALMMLTTVASFFRRRPVTA